MLGAMWDELETANPGVFILYSTWIIVLYYVDLKQEIRQAGIEGIEAAMGPTYNILLATGHWNVADQIVRSCWNDLTLLPEVNEVVKHHQLATMSNRMACDGCVFLLEKTNDKVNHRLGGATDINAISEAIVAFNATDPVEDMLSEMFGIDSEPQDCTRAHEDNVNGTYEYYRDVLENEDVNQLYCPDNPFTGKPMTESVPGYNRLGQFISPGNVKVDKKIKVFIEKHDIKGAT